MNVASYTYQTPSSSAVQVGRLVPSSVKKEEKETAQTKSDVSMQAPNETLATAQNFQAKQSTEATPTVGSQNALDLYV